MEMLGYDVINVGERDVRQGYDALVETLGERDVPLVSANLVRNDTKQPVFPPSIVIDVAAPSGDRTVKVGVVGVMRFNPIFRKPGPDGSEMAIVHPVEAVKSAVAELKKTGVEIVVLLAALHRDDAARIAEAVPELDFVIGSYGGHYTSKEDAVGDAWLLYSGNQGKRFGETRVYRDDDGTLAQWSRMHLLTRMYPSDLSMVEFVNAVPSVSEEVAAKQSVTAADPATRGGPYVGSESCKSCHASEYEQWEQTAHAHAFETLGEEHRDRTDCRSCHTVASGVAGGFVSVESTPDLASVGCESCHGAGREHTRQPTSRYGAVGLSSCTVCHDPGNSPKFDYYSYVDKVNHQAAP
jgi:2',3'-cyclic-nucleotide 2'-phosphodiesterase (5'-nucleotidase family)